MDLTQLDLTGAAEAGFDFTPLNPLTGKETDIVIHLIGSESRAYRSVKTAAARKNAMLASRSKNKDVVKVDIDEINLDAYSACVTGWKNIFEGDVEFTYSPGNARQLLHKYPWLLDQVIVAVETRSNFTVKPTSN